MKKHSFFILCMLCMQSISGSTDFTGFWKVNQMGCDCYGVQIKKIDTKTYSIVHCSSVGCTGPNRYFHNSSIDGDVKVKVINKDAISLNISEDYWDELTKCSQDPNPVLKCQDDSSEEETHEELTDPRRPPCETPSCKKIEKFLILNYCKNMAIGNGPDIGCEIYQGPTNLKSYSSDIKRSSLTKKPTISTLSEVEIRRAVEIEMMRIGLPEKEKSDIKISSYHSPDDWILVNGWFSKTNDLERDVCKVILVINKESKPLVLRTTPYVKADLDRGDYSAWSLLDINDIDGDKTFEIVLEGWEYENHWIEVIKISGDQFKTIYSGLGYYL